MRVTRRRTLKIVIAVLLFCFLSALFIHNVEEIDNFSKIILIEESISSPMNQGECRIPDLPIDNPEIMKFYKPVDAIDCGYAFDDWVACEKSVCFVKPEINASHGEVVCSYTDLIRKNDYKIKYGKTTKTKNPYILKDSDFVKVVCNSEESGASWNGMAYGIRDGVAHPVAPNFINLRQIPAEAFIINAPVYVDHDSQFMDTAPMYNVLMLGFDSLSRNAFMRKLPKTYAYLIQELEAIVLKGYNIVGDGTPQALVPLLTGYTELELPDTRKRMRNSQSVDSYPMLWKEFTRHGYVTSFNEDLPNVGTFTYRMTGFDKQPVHHYLRTFYVEADNLWSGNKANCIGHLPDHVVMLDYTRNFMNKYSGTPRFVFSFHGGLSHDSINLVGAADEDVVAWLALLNEKGLLDNTIVVMMSDHGNRFSEVRSTLQGKQEERLPFFSFAFPQSFRKRFPNQYANFQANAERLTTPFDVHATFIDLLGIQLTTPNAAYLSRPKNFEDYTDESLLNRPVLTNLANERAISLFEVIPQNRSCADAYIEPHWCACLKWQEMDLEDTNNSGLLLKLAASIVDSMNAATEEFSEHCATLELMKINWVMRLQPNKDLLKFKNSMDRDGFMADLSDDTQQHEQIYQLQIVTLPGESLFEASVTYDLKTFEAHTKLTEISRINKYGSQANCIYERNPELRKYCYCKKQ